MSVTLTGPIAAYFDAHTAQDTSTMLSVFTEDARVHDEEHDYRGTTAIGAWADDSHSKYKLAFVPTKITQNGAETIVNTDMSGNFPGSPLAMTFEFTLAGDKISALTIHD